MYMRFDVRDQSGYYAETHNQITDTKLPYPANDKRPFALQEVK